MERTKQVNGKSREKGVLEVDELEVERMEYQGNGKGEGMAKLKVIES